MYSIHEKMRPADDCPHPGMPSLNMVVGSGLVLIEIVPVNVSVDPGGSEVVDQLINSGDIWDVLLDCKPGCSDILYVSGLNATN